MPRITIDSIQEELKRDQWTLISTKYKNLDTNLEFKCDQGHVVIAPWRTIREHRTCPTCMRARLKTDETKIRHKKPSEFRVLALDQATHVSGYAVYNNYDLIDYGVFNAIGITDTARNVQVKQWMLSLIDRYDIDLVGLEGIQYQTQAGVTTFETLARLQGLLMATCEEEGVNYKVAPTNTWRAHCGVKGTTRPDRKRSMQNLVKQWFDIFPTEDECDAIGIGRYFSDTYMPKVEIVDWENMG